MVRKILFPIVIAAVVLVSLYVARTQPEGRLKPSDDMLGQEAVCPVLGNRFVISENTPVVEYKGIHYYFCCAGCDETFLKEPEKYVQNTDTDDEKNDAPADSTDEIAYWTCSMHPEVRAEQEGNCPICGMNLIPVHTHSSRSHMQLSDDAIRLAGITTMSAIQRQAYREIHAVGRVAYDPNLLVAQEEYINALEMFETLGSSDELTRTRAANMLAKSTQKLKLLGMDDAEIATLRRTRQVDRSLLIPEQTAWVYAEVYELDIGLVARGQTAVVRSMAYPGRQFHGIVRSINPVVNSRTNTVQVRIRLNETEQKMIPGMYVDAIIRAPYHVLSEASGRGHAAAKNLIVPKSSVIDTGTRTVVWVYVGEGSFEPRNVSVGPLVYITDDPSRHDYYPVLEGLQEGDVVVVNGNFLLDSESRLKGIAALGYSGALDIETPSSSSAGHQH